MTLSNVSIRYISAAVATSIVNGLLVALDIWTASLFLATLVGAIIACLVSWAAEES